MLWGLYGKAECLVHGISLMVSFNSFNKSKISSDLDLISEDLKRARKEKGLGLKEAAEKTKINYKYLEALEKGQFSSLPSGLYGKNFLKQYASFLGLGAERILDVFEKADFDKSEGDKNLFSNQIVKNKHFFLMPRLIKNILVVFVTSLFFVYLLFSFQKILSPPHLKLHQPSENFVSDSATLVVRGESEEGVDLKINGNTVLLDLNNIFQTELNLKQGMNEIVVEARKKYGDPTVIKRQVLFER